MNTALKIVASIIALVLLALGALVAYMTTLFDPNEYRAEIERQAMENAGIELTLNGPIGWSLYPWLAIDLNDLNVRYPNKPELANLQSARAALNLSSLISGKLEIDRVTVQGLDLNLVRDKNGNTNWASTQTSNASSDSTSAESSREDSAKALAIAGIELSEANIRFSDEVTGQQVALQDLNLVVEQLSLNTPVPIRLTTQLSQQQNGTLLLDLPLSLNTSLTLNLDQQTATFDNINVSAGVFSAAMELALTNFEDPSFTGVIDIPKTSIPDLAEQFSVTLPTLTENALQHVAVSSKLQGDTRSISLNDLSLSFDNSQFTGTIATDLNTLAMQVNLSGDQLNIDHYTAPPSKDTQKKPASDGWPSEAIDLALPITDNSSYVVTLDTLTVVQQTLTDIVLNAHTANRVLTVDNLSAKGFGGQMTTTATLDARTSTPVISINPDFVNIEAQQLMAIAMDDPLLAAKVNLKGNLTTSGQSVEQFINELNGKLTLSADEGVIKGIDMAQEMCQKIENLTSLGFDPDQVDRTTPIANLNSDFVIKKGVVTNPGLTASVDAANLDAQGVIDLPKQALKYTLGLTIKEDLFQKSCGINPALRGTRIPVNCEGRFDTDPVKLCKLDTRFVGEMIKKAAGVKLQAEIDQKKEELEQQAKEKLQDTLKDKLGEQLNSGDAGSLLKGLFSK